MNDLSEISYGLEVLRRVWNSWDRSTLSDEQSVVGDRVLNSANLDRLIDSLYFFCACADGDALNQWQGYAGDRGFSIEIDTAAHLAPLDTSGQGDAGGLFMHVVPGWYRVIYDPAEQERLVRKVLDFALSGGGYRDGRPLDSGHLETFLGTVIAQFKHPSFNAEREVRFIALRRGPDLPERFRSGRSGVIPYVELVCPPGEGRHLVSYPGQDPPGPLPLKSLTCGPADAAEAALIASAASRLMEAHGYDVRVHRSRVPYRFFRI
ncbi:DUF2971 domain-containing protein [Georgenia sp. 311]|uniref:DUF2971 domain-containing protein n=1 Tax=Georgenia sp. 311 TaxID=2585134 RepID=UPI00350E3783